MGVLTIATWRCAAGVVQGRLLLGLLESGLRGTSLSRVSKLDLQRNRAVLCNLHVVE